jgi:peptidyl-prolyl cis-trans isomerase SurA
MTPKRLTGVISTALLTASVTCFSGEAHATIIERVVALVGERPILLSELRERTKPFAQNLPQTPSERAAAESELYSEMLGRMVDEELLRRVASEAQVSVDREEVEAAIARVASGNGVTVEELLAEVERSGVSAAQYRIELRRQLLDAKVLNVRLQGRIRISEDDVRAEYQQLVSSERQQLEFRAAVIRLDLPATATSTETAKLLAQARNGDDFSELSRSHSTDAATRESAGLLPSMRPAQLPPELQSVVLKLEVGEVGAPVRSGNTLVIIKLLERAESSLPSYEKATGQLQQRVQMRKMEKARRTWLDGLRKRTHVEIRL